MGRRRSIDREQVLIAAEGLVGRLGANALTIEAVAQAAGISKGGVQSCFGTKEALVAAMLKRSFGEFDRCISERLPPEPSAQARIAGYVEVTAGYDDQVQSRAANLLATLVATPEHLSEAQDWYRRLGDDLDVARLGDRMARLALLATEGAFFLRSFGLLQIDDASWSDIFRDVRALLDTDQQPKEPQP